MDNILKCADRKQLEYWLSRNKQAEKQIDLLTTDPVSKKKYAVLFRHEAERRILRAAPPEYKSYQRYAMYQHLRNEIHAYFGYDTRMMTKTEYELAIQYMTKLGYYED